MQEEFHIPVMVREVLEYLDVRCGKNYIDATLGGGGHAAAILEKGGLVLGLDADPGAVGHARKKLKPLKNLKLAHGNFRNIEKIAQEGGFKEIDGILFDLGMSSWQIKRSGRGFSFQRDEPLDMRVDPKLSVTAADLVNGLSRKELYDLFQKFGEEKLSRPITNAIVRARRLEPIKTTKQLVRLIVEVYKGKQVKSRVHPATRCFQALRIVVNDELENLKQALPRAIKLLAPGGRLVVVSFHSLEDRVGKRVFAEFTRNGQVKILTKRPIRPLAEEVQANPSASSAKLRAVQKL